MKVSSSGEKPKSLLDLVSNSSEAVKVSTGNKSSALTQAEKVETSPTSLSEAKDDKAISIELGLSKYLAEELDPKKVSEDRQAKIAALKAKIESGTYFSSVNLENVAQKILEESQLESLIVERAVSNE